MLEFILDVIAIVVAMDEQHFIDFNEDSFGSFWSLKQCDSLKYWGSIQFLPLFWMRVPYNLIHSICWIDYPI